MYRARQTAVWLLAGTIAFPANVVAATIGSTATARGTVAAIGKMVPWSPPVPARPTATSAYAPAAAVVGPCLNAIDCENRQPGVSPLEWDLPNKDAGDSSLQGFATSMSVNAGETVRFKIDTLHTYKIDIYRLGYYQGNGARHIATVSDTVTTDQPVCMSDPLTGLYDCGNWSVSASWLVPATAVSGIYIAKLAKTTNPSVASHIVFVVRDDARGSSLLFQTSDTTWQAYNAYGGNSLYTGSPAGRAYKVSYNRPLTIRGAGGGGQATSLFNAEYPMVRWLEQNGYDVSYTSGIDTDRRGAELLEHKVFLSVGHDEYWSGAQRANVEAARDHATTPVHLAFFSANEVFWKIRWENSIDGSGTPYRTLVCYKETHANAKIDPVLTEWTGTWRDNRAFNPQGPKPENALTGTIFTVNGTRNDSIMVPAIYGAHRFWRNTSIATLQPGQTAILPQGTLGYEWDEDLDNGFRPAGLQRLSSTTVDVTPLYLQDNGSNYGVGTATHSLTLYRASSGALVFGAGTVQWSWGLDSNHDRAGEDPSDEMEQATVNLFADMGVQPASLRGGLTSGSQLIDLSAPTSSVLNPPAGAVVQSGDPVVISGTASDDRSLASIEVSVNGGATWAQATGLQNWTFAWTPSGTGPVTIMSRAFDDSGNLQTTPSSVTVTVSRQCPCTIWSAAVVPATPDSGDATPTEVGMRFRAESNGVITGLRFYKAAGNIGTHTGSLWGEDGGLPLARAVFVNETPSGWQQVNFDTPVPIAAGTTYVASYHAPTGRYSAERPSVSRPADGFAAAVNNPPLQALRDG
jgi:hypothetical protein